MPQLEKAVFTGTKLTAKMSSYIRDIIKILMEKALKQED